MLSLAPATDVPHLAAHAPAASLAYGLQTTAPTSAAAADHPPARVYLAAVRLPGVGTDVLVTLNAPLAPGETRDAAAAAEAAHLATLRALLRSLRVHDWGLFGGKDAAPS